MSQQRLRRRGRKVGSYNETSMANRAWASSQPDQKAPTKTKRQRRKAGAALPPSAVLASSPKTGVAPYPNNSLPSDVPPAPNATAVAPLGTNFSSPSGGAVVPPANSIAPSSPITAAATPETGSGNDRAVEKTAKGQTCTIMLPKYGDIATVVAAIHAWEALSVAIEELARVHFVKMVDCGTLDSDNKEKLAAWAPWAEKYLTCDYEPGSQTRYESQTIFEGWIWRILVDRMFKAHDGEVWEGYGGLLTELGDMAMLPPHLLTRQHAGPITFGMEGWQERSSHLIKQLYYNWRPRTAELLRLATGHRNRFDQGYVAGLIREELGVFFRQPDPGQQGDEEKFGGGLNEILAEVVDAAVVADSCFQSSVVEWQILFADPVTGKTSGFPYQGPDRCLTNKREMAHYLVDVHVGQSTMKERAMGRPVHHIVRPLLRGYTLSRRTCTWDRRSQMVPMVVMVDLGRGESSDDERGEEAGAEAEGEEGEGGEGEDETEENRSERASA